MHVANAAFTCSESTLFLHYYIHLTLLKQFEEHVDCTENLEADLTSDHIRPTFEKLIDAHPNLPTRALRVY